MNIREERITRDGITESYDASRNVLALDCAAIRTASRHAADRRLAGGRALLLQESTFRSLKDFGILHHALVSPSMKGLTRWLLTIGVATALGLASALPVLGREREQPAI